MKKYDLHSIMRAAWKFFRKGISSFSLALRMAWANAKTQNAAKAAGRDHRGDTHLVRLERAWL